MSLDFAEKIFSGTKEKVSKGICPTCDNKVSGFRNEISKKEYNISGMCQRCQDSVFGGM